MTRSSLTDYVATSPNYESRQGCHAIKIAIHHMAGCLTVEQCGNVFASSAREASTHYGIRDTRIGNYVPEEYAAWALGNRYWNLRSINIELSNSTGASGGWKVSDTTIETCIKLVADIAYRLGWTYISYTGDMTGDIIAHRWVIATACPGDYLYSKLAYIAREADKLLKAMRSGNPIPTISKDSNPYVDKNGKLTVDGKFGCYSCMKAQKWLGVPFTPDGSLEYQLESQAKYILNMEYCVDYYDGGDGSPTVELLQKLLNKELKNVKGFVRLEVDGLLGKLTIMALQTFLNLHGAKLEVDGYAGPLTCSAFQRYLNSVA